MASAEGNPANSEDREQLEAKSNESSLMLESISDTAKKDKFHAIVNYETIGDI